ncbi:ATPase (AAA) domain protein [Pleurostoma richardsiae]|uniref:ATPase (AAA) domain protein n=1 Tax=Pleurostoma richardsiae TaxID=41990 RepID=A0AA38R8A6_9PEZI|nr:ATPase (AAA) domain protein [Pleurostoma richardsiae]
MVEAPPSSVPPPLSPLLAGPPQDDKGAAAKEPRPVLVDGSAPAVADGLPTPPAIDAGVSAGNADDSSASPSPTLAPIDVAPQQTKDSAWIRYRIEYRDRINDSVLYRRDVEGPDSTLLDQLNDGPAFEVLTRFRTTNIDAGERRRRGPGGPPPPPGPPGRVQPMRVMPVSSAPTYHLRIYSVAIIHALQSVVQYYPGQDLIGDIIEIRWPYPILVHHYNELAEFRDRCASKKKEELCVREKDAAEHLRLLLGYLDEKIMPEVEAERERNKRGNRTFAGIWLTHKPGATIMFKTDTSPDWETYVVQSITGGVFENPPQEWSILGWRLAYDGKYLGRVPYTNVTGKFDGEEEYASHLRVFDLDAPLEDEESKELIEYGKLYWKLLKKQCMYYKGKCQNFPYNDVDGLVMADLETFFAERDWAIPRLIGTGDCRNWTSDCTCPVCKERGVDTSQNMTPLFEEFNFITLEDWDDLSDQQYLLCPVEMMAFVFRTRTWERLHVKDFQQPKFEENMIDSLVMDERRVGTLKALAKSFARIDTHGVEMKREAWTADFVKGKGNGLIFLLHGKPGVGKTCTAECIAEFTRRPLMVLTCSDIGTNPGTVEVNLTRSFKTARSWGAVLLIDEADVFMERRGPADLERNSLVAGFLRSLEFYDGILFLTTNRVGAFDDAFISRVHVQLYYPDFTDDQRQKVWQTFLDKLSRERGDYMRISMDAKDYVYGSAMRALKWNGREIRNAFQTAVSLAEYEAKKDEEGRVVLTDDHLRAVVELSKDFKDYLNNLHKGDEGKRAERRYERLDN